MPPPPRTDVPKCNNPLNNKLGNRDTPDPRSEFEKPETPKPEFPKPEPAEIRRQGRREFPKFANERPSENDENDENCDLAGAFEKRYESNLPRKACMSDEFARLAAEKEFSETFLPKDPFLEFPNECHWPPGPAHRSYNRAPVPPCHCHQSCRRNAKRRPEGSLKCAPIQSSTGSPSYQTLPPCPPPMAIPGVRAEPSVDRKPEFPDDCHPPMALREPRAAACEAPE